MIWHAPTQTQIVIAQTLLGEANGPAYYPDTWVDEMHAIATGIYNRMNDPRFDNDYISVCTAEGQYYGYLLGKERYESGNYDVSVWDTAMAFAVSMTDGSFLPHPLLASEDVYQYSELWGDPNFIYDIYNQNPDAIQIGGEIFYRKWPR